MIFSHTLWIMQTRSSLTWSVWKTWRGSVTCDCLQTGLLAISVLKKREMCLQLGKSPGRAGLRMYINNGK